MASHFTGPLLGQNKKSGSREWYSERPLDNDPDFIHERWDFVKPSDLDTTNDWTVVKDTGAAVAVAADEDGGAITLTSAATTDNDGSSIQSVQNVFSLSSGKQVWLEGRLKISDADQMDVYFGFSDTFATNPEAVLTDDDKCGFQIDDGSASILAKSEKNGTETSTDTGKDAVDNTYVTLGLHWDGVSSVKYFVDGERVAAHTTNIPDDLQLAIAVMELSGDATGTKSMTLDYIDVMQER